MSLAERLRTIGFTVDETPHIVVDGDRCRACDAHTCTAFCPAECFTANDAGGIDYYYVGCLECGTCLVLCDQEAVSWNYPQGGFGIAYRY
jgi:ferredoxin like protein